MIHFAQPLCLLDIIFAWLRSPFDFPRIKEVHPPSLGIFPRASSAYNELVDDGVLMLQLQLRTFIANT